MPIWFTSLFLCFLPLFANAITDVLRDLHSVNTACTDFAHDTPFALTTKVEYVSRPEKYWMSLHVRSGERWSTLILSNDFFEVAQVKAGDTIRASGRLLANSPTPDTPLVTNLTVLAQGKPSPPLVVPLTEVLDNRYYHAIVRISGLVTDTFNDEIDQRFIWLRLTDGQTTVYVSVQAPKTAHKTLLGAHISAPAKVMAKTDGIRLKIIKHLYIIDYARLRIMHPAPADPFDIPGRTRCSGRVIACWQTRNALLKTRPHDGQESQYCRVEFAEAPYPACGAHIEAAGFPATDFYSENLTRAIWRPIPPRDEPEDEPTDADPKSILEEGWRGGRLSGINPDFHGTLIRLTGRILDKAGHDRKINMECSGYTVPIDLSNIPPEQDKLLPGCRAAVTGICVMDIPNWTPGGPFPQISGFTLVTRSASDIDILAKPPWWTPTRFLIVLGALVMLIVLVLVWNVSLRILVARRSRQLVREQAQKLDAELRIDERTRLAAELHDSVAQNLSSVSMQLDAVQLAAHNLAEPFRAALDLASKTLLSCRQELRNCLWDLRSQALNEPDLGSAVLKTLKPHLCGAVLRIRFNVSRRLVSDQTAHAVLRILRELAANAIRHGHAKNLTVAGCLDGRLLMFSLSDDGTGFDPQCVAGVDSGHFGLSGIRDRIKKTHGTFEILSEPGRGTKAVVTLNAQ